MSTWWRQARDRDGKTIAERLEESFDWAFTREREKRIRSIIRRLKRCPACIGRGCDLGVSRATIGSVDGLDLFYLEPCPVCGGTGRVRNEG